MEEIQSVVSFTLAEGFANEYRANLPATLRLLNVDNTEGYVYTLQVSYDLNNVPHRMDDSVTVIVRGKSNIFFFYTLDVLRSDRAFFSLSSRF